MNDLYDALQAHYAAAGCILLDVAPNTYRAVRWQRFHDRWDAVLVVEAVLLERVGKPLAELVSAYPADRPVLVTWKDSITEGDKAALKAQGVTVLALERAVAYAM